MVHNLNSYSVVHCRLIVSIRPLCFKINININLSYSKLTSFTLSAIKAWCTGAIEVV